MVGDSSGLTRAQAEKVFRKLQDAEDRAPRPRRGEIVPTVDEIADPLRRQLRLRGSRPSYLEGCESMQRVHISPRLGGKPITDVKTAHGEALATGMLEAGRAPKTVRNVLTFLHSVFELALERGLVSVNPVRGATRPGRRRNGDANPDLQFLTVEELDAVIRAIPDEIVVREPKSSRRGKSGPSPPPPPDVLGPVLRVLVLAAAMTGLRQSELLGLRWRDVDWTVQRIRVRNAFVRGEHSGEGKSDLSTRRSVPMADFLGWGPGGRRFKSCLPDLGFALQTSHRIWSEPGGGRPVSQLCEVRTVGVGMVRLLGLLTRLLSVWLMVVGVCLCGGASARATSVLSWGPLMTIPHEPAYSSRPAVPAALSCVGVSLCVGIDSLGDVVSTTDPTASAAAWSISRLRLPADPDSQSNQLKAVSCPSVSLCVAIDSTGDVVTSRDPTGGTGDWKVTHLDGVSASDLWGVSCPSVSLCVAIDPGDPDGQVFTSTDPAGGATAWTATPVASDMTTISCGSPSLCVASYPGAGELITSTDPTGGAGSWPVTTGVPVDDLTCSGSSFCAGVNASGDVVTSMDATGGASAWTATPVDNTGVIPGTCGTAGCQNNSLTGISCASVSLCVATDYLGNIISSGDPTGRPSAWATVPTGEGPLSSVSCALPSLCAVISSGGDALVSDDPTSGSSAWQIARNVDVLTALTSLACASSSLCVAVDSTGDVLTSTKPTAARSRWTIIPVDDRNSLRGVACASVSLCVAVDQDGDILTSTHPARGKSAWKATNVDGANAIVGVSCPTISLCAAVDTAGDVITSTDPTASQPAWKITHIDTKTPNLESVSCPTTSFCIAVDGDGDVLSTRQPTGPASSWTLTYADTLTGPKYPTLSSVSCPTASLCAAVGAYGTVFTSRNPAGPATAWKSAHIDGTNTLNGVTCSSATLCVAFDRYGDTFASRNPTGGVHAWSTRRVNAGDLLTGLACPTRSHCIAIGRTWHESVANIHSMTARASLRTAERPAGQR
jgi:hypothetical protein